jgi:superfamily II DNA/RNA helicase
MNVEMTTEVIYSNDRPDIGLMVQELKYPSSSYKDLSFLIPHNWREGMNPPRKFLVFFDDIKEAEGAKDFFHQRLLKKYHSKIAWFHSTMSQEYRQLKVEDFRRGDLWGLFCTDAFGLVSSYFISLDVKKKTYIGREWISGT